MAIERDPSKRAKTLRERGLDFDRDAETVFAGETFTLTDDRRDYGEIRFQTYGLLAGKVVQVVWTPRGAERRIISMRYCHGREERRAREAYARD